MIFEETYGHVVEWGYQKGIIPQANYAAQLDKLREEVQELEDALDVRSTDAIVDALGDCVVVLTMIAAIENLRLSEAYEGAYNVISTRTGKMVGGKFVKD